MQRAILQVGVEHGREITSECRIFQRDGHAVGESDPDHSHDRIARRQSEIGDLCGTRSVQRRREQPGARLGAASLHLLGKGQENPGASMHRTAGDEGALTAAPLHQSFVRELRKRLSDGHPADTESLTQVGLARQRIARLAVPYQFACITFDLVDTVPELVTSDVVDEPTGRL